MILLPGVSVMLLILRFAVWFERRESRAPWREAILAGAVCGGVALIVITEFLSAFNALTPTGVGWAWSLFLIFTGILLLREPRIPRLPGLDSSDCLPGIGIGLLVALTGIVAYVAAPNNWDSMTYHLARSLHWVLNENVAPYATHVPRQLFRQPLAEFATTHLMVLNGNDQWVNLVQWASWIGCQIGASLIAREFGASRRGQWIAALFVATLPIAILEASSTQNDLVAALWLVCLAYYVVRAASGTMHPLLFGASLGLAIATKGTVYLFALPFVFWMAPLLWCEGRRRAVKVALVMAILAISLNVGPWVRNIQIYGRPIGQEGRLVSRTVDPRFALTSVLRNSAMEVAMPVRVWNDSLETGVREVHLLLGISADDERSTYPGIPFGLLRTGEDSDWAQDLVQVFLHEDYAPNPLHFALALICGIALLRRHVGGVADWYTIAVAAAILLFCAALRWQPWHTRLHLPLFVLMAPVVAVVMGRWRSSMQTGICALLLVCSLPWVLLNATRPILGERSIFRTPRLEQYLASKPELRADYEGIAQTVHERGWTRLGLVSGGDAGIYPLYKFLGPTVDLRDVDVTNESAPFADPEFLPEATIYLPSPNGSLPQTSSRVPVWKGKLAWIILAATD